MLQALFHAWERRLASTTKDRIVRPFEWGLDWMPGELPPPMMSRWNYLHISKDVLPMLRDEGVTDDQIHQMLVDNPRRYFERQGAY